MRVAYYARVNPDAHVLLASQESSLLDEIARHPDWKLAGTYAEVGAAGTLERPALDELRRNARHGRLDLVVVTDLARFSRRSDLAATVVAELASYGLRVQVIGDPEPLDGDRLAVHLGQAPPLPATPRRTAQPPDRSQTIRYGGRR